MSPPLLEVERLCVDYVEGDRFVRIVDEASLTLARGEMLGLVGESGCGKSTLARAMLRVLGPPAVVTGGSVRLGGEELLTMSAARLRAVRWKRAAIVFQGALDALNPVLTVRAQLLDGLRAHADVSAAAARAEAERLVDLVSLPRHVLDRHPHELSGGMRQRVAIAMALSLSPDLLVMDEPTTALDVVVQAELLDEVDRLRSAMGFAVLIVSHDLPLMLERCDRIGVMYAGRLVETAPVEVMRTGPAHPYTRHLVAAHATLDGPRQFPPMLEGRPPDLHEPPPGCRFHPRCASRSVRCASEAPRLVRMGAGHEASCHLAPDHAAV